MKQLSYLMTLAVIALMSLSHGARADDWPNRPVRIIIPYAAGGIADVVGRTFADGLGTLLGKTFVVENRTGAGGVVASEAVARSTPDGYTLMVSGFPSHIGSPGINPNATFDAMRDFTHIAFLGGPPNVLVVHPSFGAQSFSEFIERLKTKGGVEYATAGLGTTGNVMMEYFKATSGLPVTHVGYRGGAGALTDLIAGHVKVGVISLPTTLPHLRGGGLIPLAISSAERAPDLPDVPTFKELGYPGLVTTTWFSLSGPAGLPQYVTNKVNRAVIESLRAKKVEEILARERVQVEPMTPAEITKFVGAERDKWSPVFTLLRKAK
jgi:tripartite-type tricarboxylate transporter receptor subunit TctC